VIPTPFSGALGVNTLNIPKEIEVKTLEEAGVAFHVSLLSLIGNYIYATTSIPSRPLLLDFINQEDDNDLEKASN